MIQTFLPFEQIIKNSFPQTGYLFVRVLTQKNVVHATISLNEMWLFVTGINNLIIIIKNLQ